MAAKGPAPLANGGIGGAPIPGAPAAGATNYTPPGKQPAGSQGPAGPQGPNPPEGPGTAIGDARRNALSAYGNGPNPNQGFIDFVNSPLGHYLSAQNQAPNAGNYLQAFQGALGSARSDIAQQLSGALSDIKANQAYAQQALGQLPGQINTSYGTADALMNNGQRAAQAGMNAPGLNAGTAANTGGSLDQYMAPERAAIAGEKAGEMANVPLLGVGIQQAANQEAAAANNAALSDYGNLAQQQAQLSGQAQIAAMQAQAGQTQQTNQNIFSLLQGAQNNKYTLGQILAQGQGAGNSPTYGGLTQAQVAQVQASPQYLQAVQAVQGGQYKTKADLQKAYPANPALWQTIASQYGLS